MKLVRCMNSDSASATAASGSRAVNLKRILRDTRVAIDGDETRRSRFFELPILGVIRIWPKMQV